MDISNPGGAGGGGYPDATGSNEDAIRQVAINYNMSRATTNTEETTVEINPNVFNANNDAFATDTIGAGSTGELYDAGGDFYNTTFPVSIADDMESYADSNAIRVAYVSSNPGIGAGEARANLATSPAPPDASQMLSWSIGNGFVGTCTGTFENEIDASDSDTFDFQRNGSTGAVDVGVEIYDETSGWHTLAVISHTSTVWTATALDITGIAAGNRARISKIRLTFNQTGTESWYFDNFQVVADTRSDMTLNGLANVPASDQSVNNATLAFHVDDMTAITLNTDIKAFITTDGGSNYTELTLENKGADSDAHIRLQGEDMALAEGQDVRYRISTHNAIAIEVHSVSLQWIDSGVITVTPATP